MKAFTVSFFGHREMYDFRSIDQILEPILRDLIREKEYTSFLVGRNGDFDEYIASMIKKVKRDHGEEICELMLVLPYNVAKVEYYENYYDSIVIPDAVYGVYPKAAIATRNRWMIEQSDLVIVNVCRNKGGAYEAKRYAEKLNKKVVNLHIHSV